MGLSFFIIATCLIFGFIAAVASFRPNLIPELNEHLRKVDPVKKFSPRKTLFLIGPSANHPACRMQRRLLKPAIPALIRDDVAVMEIYGEDTPRKNGELMDWLDPSLLRHALNAEDGFYVLFVDDAGRTLFKSEAPMVTDDLLHRARLNIDAPKRDQTNAAPQSSILDKLRAA
ncbi:MAG: hypothetical protein AAGC77_03905 [Pseudomonadota bacterium]